MSKSCEFIKRTVRGPSEGDKNESLRRRLGDTRGPHRRACILLLILEISRKNEDASEKIRGEPGLNR